MFLSYSCAEQDFEMEQNTTSAAGSKMLIDEFPGEITSVYFQDWVAGVRGGGSGTDFYIELGQPLPEGIVLDQVYFRDKRAPLNMKTKTFYEVGFLNNVNNDNDDFLIGKNQNETGDKAVSLAADDTQAVLIYYENDVLKSYLLTNIKEVSPLEYP